MDPTLPWETLASLFAVLLAFLSATAGIAFGPRA